MTRLADLQSQFRAAMLNGNSDQILTTIKPGGVAPEVSLLVYRNNIASSLTRALHDLYPVVGRLVGEEFFNALARKYMPTEPLPHGRLVDYGHGFPAFLRDFPPATELPYLADVAALELAWNKAFHAADAQVIAPEGLQSIAPADFPRLNVHLHPSCQVMWSGHPIVAIWSANQDGVRHDQTVDLSAGPDHVFIARPHQEVLIYRLPEDEWAFAHALHCTETLGAAFDTAAAVSPDFDLEMAFTRLLQIGAITNLTLPS